MKVLSQPNTQHQHINTSLEIELILNCVRPQVDDAVTNRIKALMKEDIDWEKLLEVARQNSLIPLLYSRISNTSLEAVPELALAQLRSRYHLIAQRNLFLTGELLKLLALLKQQGIVALPYKGPILAATIYGNVAMRSFCDLDIMVEQQDIFSVKKLLIAEGYRPNIEMTNAELINYLNTKTEHTYDFIHDKKNILVEVHWRFTPKYISPIEPKDLWENLQLFSFAGTTVNNFSLEDYLPILCVHGSRHIWQRLAWLCDIATLVHNNPNLNWEKVIQRANFWGCKRRLCLGILMVHRLFEVTLSEQIWHSISEDASINNLVPQIYDEIFGEVKTSDKFMGTTLYHIQTRERLQDKFLYVQSFANWLIKGSKYKTA
jgi:Uncharacterised nucleotidyltransferase